MAGISPLLPLPFTILLTPLWLASLPSSSPPHHYRFLPPASDKLRGALGIGETDYPPYVYRMREIGYPPGYTLLEEEETLGVYDDVSATDEGEH